MALSIDIKHQDEGLSLWRWAVVLLSPFGHFSRFHFTIEIIILAFIFLHTSNVLGQFTTLIVTIVTPYFAVFSLLVLEEPSVAVGTISASAALLTIAMIANARQILQLSWIAQAIALGFSPIYFVFAPLGAIISAMSGIAIGVHASYLSNINVSRSEQSLSRPLLAITYYPVPLRIALLAYPITIVLLLWGILFGAN